MNGQFHLSKFGPTAPWPNGGWSLYRITGDEIASRTAFDDQGRVISRDSWPGFVGCFKSLKDVTTAIENLDI